MKLALVGLPGCGKSTIGRQLSHRLALSYVDTDNEIEAEIGMPIRAYFDQHGEEAFRDVEQFVLQRLCERGDMVLATGGGAVLRAANRAALKRDCTVVYLRASADDLWRRLRHDTKRPLLQVSDGLSRLRQLAEEREPLYRQIADIVVDTGKPSVRTIMNIIAMQVELANPKAVPPHLGMDDSPP
ncbi:shikimate kinase [Schlegelella sp. S2-27]|uniref:Shikimate kinase n=1 Tax=Caldimonas mangrovi TaxID=2944811 RepID=A0ABT0YIM7_9BURK|nr:shikimate kinase [Caldimonas mangrovi]